MPIPMCIRPLSLVILFACGSLALADTPSQDAVPLYDNLGEHHHPITTQVPKAQQYFDQGLRLSYAFNHAEAIRAFTEAARLDPDCAICYWGIALAYGPNINAPMDAESGRKAYVALQKALELAPKAGAAERAYIEALTRRYTQEPPAERAALDAAYAQAMKKVIEQYPDDLDAATLYAEALMDTRPWNYWNAQGEPYPETREILAQLERVIERNPNHPGACHYYIHAVEARYPERAVPCADRLPQLMPGAGHLVHMPAHIYARVGRWDDAVTSNAHAVHIDEAYIADQRPGGIYPLAYYPHNYHFLAFAATMAGRSKEAIAAAQGVVDHVPLDVARQVPALEALVPYLELTLTTFGRWDELLARPLPPADLRFATGMATYARGVALAAKGRWDEAQAALDKVRETAAASGAGIAKTVLDIAAHALAGEIAARRGQLEEAIGAFRQAMALEDGLPYFEPPYWYYPIRHSLGAVLLKAGRASEAESLYREDLQRFPENGWSLYGLAASLKAQGKSAEAESVEARFRRTWGKADIELSSTRL
ncbi:MAG TPA: hypothetical protein VNN09_08940 [Candidatus Competibacteraceae bacterium]|nr:hypothetical protein [Candidatus Competibacteraceae bacterium]